MTHNPRTGELTRGSKASFPGAWDLPIGTHFHSTLEVFGGLLEAWVGRACSSEMIFYLSKQVHLRVELVAGGFLLSGPFSKLALPAVGHAVDLHLLAHPAC